MCLNSQIHSSCQNRAHGVRTLNGFAALSVSYLIGLAIFVNARVDFSNTAYGFSACFVNPRTNNKILFVHNLPLSGPGVRTPGPKFFEEFLHGTILARNIRNVVAQFGKFLANLENEQKNKPSTAFIAV